MSLYLICTGAPPTQDVHRVVPLVQARGWDVRVLATPYALPFLRLREVEALTGHPVQSEFRLPSDERLAPPMAVLAAPLTFTSLNKWAAGIADTFAVAVLTEVIGERCPVVVVPWAKPTLTSHPTFGRNVELLQSVGVTVIDGEDRAPAVAGLEVPTFPWLRSLAALTVASGSSRR